MRLKTAS